MTETVTPAELVAECVTTGSIRKLLGGVHSQTSSRVVMVCVDPDWVRVTFSADPGRLSASWEPDIEPGWLRAPRDATPGLRDASADPMLIVVGVGETQIVAVNALAVDEIGVTCARGEELIDHWRLQAQVQGAEVDADSVAGVRLSPNPEATIVIADPVVDGAEPGWAEVRAVGTSWLVRPVRKTAVSAIEPDDDTADAASTAVADDQGGVDGDSETADWQAADRQDDQRQAGADGDEEVSDDPVGEETLEPEPETDEDTTDAGPVIAAESDLTTGADTTGGAPEHRNTGRMRVFGGFEVTGADGEPLQPAQQQLVGAIGICQPIGTQALCQLLYGTSERPKSFYVVMSRIRGRGLDPKSTDAGYRIDIDSDWRQFTSLVGDDPATADTEALTQAATLIAGPLFGQQAPAWAQQQLPAMQALVCQSCRELAARHAEEPDQALAYARLGLQIDSGNAELSEIVAMLTGGSWNPAQIGA